VINSFSLSPDNKHVGIVTSAGIDLYDTTTWQSQTLFASTHFNAGGISPDWNLIALADPTGVTVYHLADQTQLIHFKLQQGVVTRLDFTPDSHNLLVSVSVTAGETISVQIENYRLPDGSLISTWNAGQIVESTLSADSKTLYAWSGSSSDGIRRESISDGKSLPALLSIAATALALSPDNRTLAVFDGKIEIVDTSNGKILSSLSGSPQDVMWLGYSPDGTQLVSISSEQIAQLWQMPDGKMLRSYPINHDDQVKAVFSPDSANIAIETLDGLEIRRVADGELQRSITGYSAGITQVALNPNGSSIAGIINNSSLYPDLAAWTLFNQTQLFQLNKTQATTLAYSHDGKELVLGLIGGSEQLIDAHSGKILGTLKEHSDNVLSVAFSPDNTLVASSAFDIRWWRVSDGKLLQDVSFPIGMGTVVSQVVFSPDGSELAAFSDGYVGLWRVSDGTLIGTFQVNAQVQYGYIGFVPTRNILAVVFKPNNDSLSPNGQPAALEYWSPSDQKLIKTIALGDIQLNSLAFSPDGSLLAFGLNDGSIQMCKVDDVSLLSTLSGHVGAITSLDFSKDGRYLVSGSTDGTIRLWGIAVK
jgi:WD40 repeat protein